ncbi:MAG: TlpA disulfide reductase family protein [bacterium]
MKKYLIWLAAIAALVLLTIIMTGAKPKPEETAKGIDFTLKDVNGKSVALSQYRGKLVVVDIFATWCEYCMDEIPNLIKMQAQYTKDKKPVQLIGIGVDRNADDVKELAKKTRFSYPVLIGEDKTVTAVFGDVQYLPTKFIISADGKILKKLTGGMSEDALKKIIDSYMPKVQPAKTAPPKGKK